MSTHTFISTMMLYIHYAQYCTIDNFRWSGGISAAGRAVLMLLLMPPGREIQFSRPGTVTLSVRAPATALLGSHAHTHTYT